MQVLSTTYSHSPVAPDPYLFESSPKISEPQSSVSASNAASTPTVPPVSDSTANAASNNGANTTSYLEPDRSQPCPNNYSSEEGGVIVLSETTTPQPLYRSFQPTAQQPHPLSHITPHTSEHYIRGNSNELEPPPLSISHSFHPILPNLPTLLYPQSHLHLHLSQQLYQQHKLPLTTSSRGEKYAIATTATATPLATTAATIPILAKPPPLMQTPAYMFPHVEHLYDPHAMLRHSRYEIPPPPLAYDYDYYSRLAYPRPPLPRAYLDRQPLLYAEHPGFGLYAPPPSHALYGRPSLGIPDLAFSQGYTPRQDHRCTTCNIRAGTEEQLSAHFKGRKHQARLEKANGGLSKKTAKTADLDDSKTTPNVTQASTDETVSTEAASVATEPASVAVTGGEAAKTQTEQQIADDVQSEPKPASDNLDDSKTTGLTSTTVTPTATTTTTENKLAKSSQLKQQRRFTTPVLPRAAYQHPSYYPPMPYYYRQPGPMYGANWGPFFPPPREPYPAFYSPFPETRRYRSAPLLPVPPKRVPLKGCEICGIPNFTSMQQSTAHMAGKKHIAKANPSTTAATTTTTSTSPATASTTARPTESVPPKILARPKNADSSNSLSPSTPSFVSSEDAVIAEVEAHNTEFPTEDVHSNGSSAVDAVVHINNVTAADAVVHIGNASTENSNESSNQN